MTTEGEGHGETRLADRGTENKNSNLVSIVVLADTFLHQLLDVIIHILVVVVTAQNDRAHQQHIQEERERERSRRVVVLRAALKTSSAISKSMSPCGRTPEGHGRKSIRETACLLPAERAKTC